MVRFSTVIFWLSFISETDSVGTTTLRTARCWPRETTRCSRLCLTLFSWPEYVLTTYQRNIQSPSTDSVADGEGRPVDAALWGCITTLAQHSEYEFDDFFGHIVGQAEIGAGDGDEAEHHRCRLGDLAPVGPLHALELCPAGAEKANGTVAAT